MSKVIIIIPTLNAGPEWEQVIKKITNQNIDDKYILIVDSGSTDNTLSIAKSHHIDFIRIDKKDFNHGSTREKYRKVNNCDIVIFLTQDALLYDNNVLNKLIKPIQNCQSSVSYARQIPRPDAGILESFPRYYNYGKKRWLCKFKL